MEIVEPGRSPETLPDRNNELTSNVFVVVPVYNEAKVIHAVVTSLTAVFRHVVVVNDGSSDNTVAVLRDTDATVLTHAVNLGQGAALQTGITYALLQGAEAIITFDGDGQHRTEDALILLRELKNGSCDAVFGSRFLGGTVNMPASRWLMLKAAVLFSNLVGKTKLTDTHNGLRVLSRKAAQALNITQNGMAHASQIIQQLSGTNLRIHEIPVTINYTEYSLSKGQSVFNAINIVIELAVGRFLK